MALVGFEHLTLDGLSPPFTRVPLSWPVGQVTPHFYRVPSVLTKMADCEQYHSTYVKPSSIITHPPSPITQSTDIPHTHQPLCTVPSTFVSDDLVWDTPQAYLI